jgi:hypothetical protein
MHPGMPTIVHFASDRTPIRIKEAYHQVHHQLATNGAGQFTHENTGHRVTLFRETIAFLEDATEEAPAARS